MLFLCSFLPVPFLLYLYNKNGNSYNLVFFSLFLFILVLVFLKKKTDKKIYDILLEQCDPKSYKEFQVSLSEKNKNNIFFKQEVAIACYYLGEFKQSITLFKYILPKYKTAKQKIFAYYWQGLCYIFLGEQELSKHCQTSIESILKSEKLKKQEQVDGQFLLNKLSLFNSIILDKLDKHAAIENLTAMNELSKIERYYLLGVNEWNKQNFTNANEYFHRIEHKKEDLFYVKDAKNKINLY